MRMLHPSLAINSVIILNCSAFVCFLCLTCLLDMFMCHHIELFQHLCALLSNMFVSLSYMFVRYVYVSFFCFQLNFACTYICPRRSFIGE